MTTNYQAPAGSPASDCSAFSVGDRVTTVKSDSLPESMEGIPCIVTAVDMATNEEYFRYEVAFRMDHKTPIRMGEDTIANEFLDRSNLRLGWCGTCGDEGTSLERMPVAPPVGSSALFSDSERLEWVIATKATVTEGERMTTRKWPPTKDNLEKVYQCEWWSKNGDLVMQSVDARHLTIREAIDAAMLSDEKRS